MANEPDTTKDAGAPEGQKPDAAPAATETDISVPNMLKALGYFVDTEGQQQIPDPEAGEAGGEGEAATEGGDKPAGEEGAPAAGEGAEGKPTEGAEPKAPAEKLAPAEKAKVIRAGELLGEDAKKQIAEVVRTAVTEVATKSDEARRAATAASAEPELQLQPHERKAITLAEFAAKELPEKYKDMPQREREWLRKNREFIAKAVEEGGDDPFDPNSEEYQQFVRRNRPTYESGDREELFMLQAEQRAARKVEERMQTELKARDRKLAQLENLPIISRVLTAARKDVLGVLPEEVAAAVEADPGKAMEDHLEAPLALIEVQNTTKRVETYLSIAKGLAEFNPKDPEHVAVGQFIVTQGRVLDSLPEEKRMRKGKLLVSRERLFRMQEAREDTSGVETLTDADVVDMLAVEGRNRLKAGIDAEYKRLEKAKYVRKTEPAAGVGKPNAAGGASAQPAAPAAPARQPEPKKAAAPKVTTTPAPGAKAGKATPPVDPAIKALGYEGVKPVKAN